MSDKEVYVKIRVGAQNDDAEQSFKKTRRAIDETSESLKNLQDLSAKSKPQEYASSFWPRQLSGSTVDSRTSADIARERVEHEQWLARVKEKADRDQASIATPKPKTQAQLEQVKALDEQIKESEYQEKFKERIALYKEANRLKADMTKHLEQEAVGEEKSRRAALGLSGQIKEDLAGIFTRLPTTVGTTIAAGVATAGALTAYSSQVMKAGMRRGMTHEDWQSNVSGIPIPTAHMAGGYFANQWWGRGAAGLLDMGSVNGGGFLQSTYQAEAEEFHAKSAQQVAAQLSAQQRNISARNMALAEASARNSAQVAGLQAGSAFGISSFGATAAGTERLSGALAGAHGLPGILREAQQADIARRASYEMSLKQQELSAIRDQSSSGAAVRNARGEYGRARGAVDEQSETVGATQRAIGGMNEGLQKDAARYTLAQQIVTLQEKQKELAAATNRLYEAESHNVEQIAANRAKSVGIMQQEYAAASQLAQSERSRVQGLRESFGELNAMERKAVVNIAEKMGRGGALEPSEWEFAKANKQYFGGKIEQMASAAAGPDFDRLAQLGNFGARGAAAEKIAMDLKQQINVQMDTNAEQLADNLLPRLQSLFEGVSNLILERFRAQQKANENIASQAWRTIFGGG